MLNLTGPNVFIIQDELRNPEQVPDMVEHIRHGGDFTKCDQLIEIAVMEDDASIYIHNGHHRCVAMYLAGRENILYEEYYCKYWKYSDYNDIVFHNPDGSWRGYITPFDIRTEARVGDLTHHKLTTKLVYDRHGDEAARLYIKQTRNLWMRPKRFFTVKELADEYLRTYVGRIAGRNDRKGLRFEKKAS